MSAKAETKSMKPVRENKGENRQTPPYLTRFERADLLGQRAKDISNNEGAPIQIDLSKCVLQDAIHIAKEEMKQGKFPFQVVRTFPNGSIEKWHLHELIDLED